MDSKQLQATLDELESDVERLKALYQQYFMGIEKMPPSVLRKKVDRIIWQLRRERFPTAGGRFKFQTLIQRYNTYEQYWARILRQIENGTYKRDVIRAAKLVGKDAAKSALGKAVSGQDIERALDAERPRPSTWSVEDDDGLDATTFGDDDKTPPSMLVPDGVARAPYPGTTWPSPQSQSGGTSWGLPPTVQAPQSYPQSQGHPLPPSYPQPPGYPQSPAAAAYAGGRAAPFGATTPSPGYPAPPSAPAPGSIPGRPPGFGPAQAGPHRPAAPSAGGYPAAPSGAGYPPPPSSIPMTAPSGAPPTGRSMHATPPAHPGTYGAPQSGRGPAPPGAPPRAPASGADSSMNEARMRQIHNDYVEARRRAGESTEGITYERLSKSLNDQTEKLRAQHPNRRLDYEVVQKDGKPVIRPVVK